MAPARAMPPITSPNAGEGCPWGHPFASVGNTAATPPRAQNDAPSKPPFSASGPAGPCPVPRAMMIDGLRARIASLSMPSRRRTGSR